MTVSELRALPDGTKLRDVIQGGVATKVGNNLLYCHVVVDLEKEAASSVLPGWEVTQ